ncbi:MAG: DsbA family protein [Sphingomonas oligoaromativorans]
MKPVFVAFVAALFAVSGTAPVEAASRAAHAPADWTRVVEQTPDGGIRMGNPNARVKLVEFFSFTCPHCAVFATTAFKPLTDKYVRSGQVSFELRSALRDALDFSVALSTRCVAPRDFFGAVEDVMAGQPDWETKAADWISAHQTELSAPDKSAAIHALMAGSGVEALIVKHGTTPAAIGRCLDDKGLQSVLEKTTNDAWNVRKIGGTPGFLLNDMIQSGVYDWAALEPKIQAALKG